jgi:hypothetical protein
LKATGKYEPIVGGVVCLNTEAKKLGEFMSSLKKWKEADDLY